MEQGVLGAVGIYYYSLLSIKSANKGITVFTPTWFQETERQREHE